MSQQIETYLSKKRDDRSINRNSNYRALAGHGNGGCMKSEVSNGDEFYFQWHITERCNKRCAHCYQDEYPATDLPLTDLEVVLDRMDEALVKWGLRGSLSLTGGEPFVRQPELFALMSISW